MFWLFQNSGYKVSLFSHIIVQMDLNLLYIPPSAYIFHFQSLKCLYIVNNAATALDFKPGFLIPRKKRVVGKELLLRLNCLRLWHSNPCCVWWKFVFLITPGYFRDSFAGFLLLSPSFTLCFIYKGSWNSMKP